MDLRTQKVYSSLMDALRQLLEEKNFEEITVNELCERAQTRRATFYKHFSDKYDFFQFMLKQMREELLQEAKNQVQMDSPKAYLHTLVDIGLLFIERNKKFLLAVKNSDVAGEMLQTITNQMLGEQHSGYLLEDELAVQFLIGGLNQCGYWWLRNMNNATKADVQNRLYELVDKYAEAVQ